MRIERLEASRHKAGRVLIFLEDGTLLKGSEREILDFSLRAGDELDDETLAQIRHEIGEIVTRYVDIEPENVEIKIILKDYICSNNTN